MKVSKPKYLKLLLEEKIKLENGTPIKSYYLNYDIGKIDMDEWAHHFRIHYCSDNELNEGAKATSKTIEEYLKEYIIPDRSNLGNSLRSGDFAEILISDLLQFVFDYEVPRYKQSDKSSKNCSEHGTDILAYKIIDNPSSPNQKDELLVTEVKANLSKIDGKECIVNALDDVRKDEQKYSFTLDFARKRLQKNGYKNESDAFMRFQQRTQHPYSIKYIAGAVSSEPGKITEITYLKDENIELKTNEEIYYIHGKDLMELAHNIYDRCIK